MKITNKIKLLSSLCAASLLAACGDSTTVNTETGTFMKGQASGVIYTTETHTGVTDENGTYQYEPGENIGFYIGDNQLGATVPAGAELGPVDLVPGVTIPTGAKEVKEFLENDRYGRSFGDLASLDAQYELMNILIFLYSADKDKTASNGIEIDPATHVAFAGYNFTLKERSRDFYYSYDLKHSFYEAYNAGAMDSARLIRRQKTLDDYSALLGLSPQVMVQASYAYDEDADGELDYSEVFNYDSRKLFSGVDFDEGSFMIEYDDYGDSVSNTYSEENEGGFDTYSGATTRDVHGNQLSGVDTENGVVNFASYYTYDNYGNRITESYDHEGDGSINVINTYAYDENGNRTERSYDSDADGVPNTIRIYAYNANGDETLYSRDDNADGTPNYIRVTTYDANGYRANRTLDTNGDGTINREYLYNYDANGNRLFYSYDSSPDGTPNYTRTYIYDANDNQLSQHYDTNGDGTVNIIYLYTYDANNNRTLYSYDSNADGTPERVTTYTYDENNNRLTESEDDNADGVADYVETRTYDANGNETSYSEEEDGELIYVETHAFDADGNEVLYQEDEDADGVIDYIKTQSWDVFGNRLERTYDYDADGMLDEVTSYTYQTVNFLGYFTFEGEGGGPGGPGGPP